MNEWNFSLILAPNELTCSGKYLYESRDIKKKRINEVFICLFVCLFVWYSNQTIFWAPYTNFTDGFPQADQIQFSFESHLFFFFIISLSFKCCQKFKVLTLFRHESYWKKRHKTKNDREMSRLPELWDAIVN